jgi:hypothetical protein
VTVDHGDLPISVWRQAALRCGACKCYDKAGAAPMPKFCGPSLSSRYRPVPTLLMVIDERPSDVLGAVAIILPPTCAQRRLAKHL